MMKEQRIFVVCLDIFEIRKEIRKISQKIFLNFKTEKSFFSHYLLLLWILNIQQQHQMNNNFND